MDLKTLVIGYVPLTDTAGKKTRQIKEDAYMKALFAEYDFGELHYAPHSDWKQKADELNPLFIIYLGNSYGAEEVKAYKGDAMLYVTYDAGQIFYRKAEMAEKQAEQRKTLKEIERLLHDARSKGEKEIETMRHFSAMSYNDLYEMIKKGLLSKEKKLHDSAWELLFGKGERHSNIVWMRMQFLAETWQKADAKSKEELMLISMNQYVDDGMARKLETFTDEDGQQYHQYMFCDFHGNDLNYIRRIPFGEKGQDGYAYEALLEKNETPANFLRLNIEAGEMRKRKEEYFAGEADKVAKVLTAWKEDPTRTKKELGVVGPDDEPLTERELGGLKSFLHKHNPGAFGKLF